MWAGKISGRRDGHCRVFVLVAAASIAISLSDGGRNLPGLISGA